MFKGIKDSDFSRSGSLFLVVLTLLFGLHTFRVYLSTTIWFLGQWLNSEQLALYALATFALTLLAPLLLRWLGQRGALTLAIGGLALMRLAFQLAHAPAADLALSTAGLAFWGWFMALWSQSPRNCPRQGDMPTLVVAFPITFLLDTVSRSLLLSYDLAWRQEGWATLLVLGLVGLALALLWRERGAFEQDDALVQYSSFSRALPLVGLGPWLYIAMCITNNSLAQAAASGDIMGYYVDGINTFCWVSLSAFGYVLVVGKAALQRWPMALANGVVLTALLALLMAEDDWGFFWWTLAAPSSWAALGQILSSVARPATQPGGRLWAWYSSIAVFLALVLMLVILITVTEYDMPWMTPVGGAMLALAALWAARVQTERDLAALRFGLLGVSLTTLPLFIMLYAWGLKMPDLQFVQPPPSRPLRVMTYNIHQGLSADNRVDLPAIAAVIAAQDPDVLVLNEVNRARATNGFVDTLGLINRRLNMPFVFGPTYADGQYGNALLSRYPILEWDNTRYSRDSTEVRGFLRAVVQAPGGPLTLYATHLDHVREPGNARAAQVDELLAAWSGQPRAILLGDLNAAPDAPELQALYQAGLLDALAATGQDDAFTYWDPLPSRRIDYIFLTPDLSLQRAWVVQSRASDHLPVLVEVQTQP